MDSRRRIDNRPPIEGQGDMTNARLDPDLLADAGRRLFGEDWQRALARALGPHHPSGPRDAIDDRLVRRWAAGERPIADWVAPVLAGMLDEEADACSETAARLRELASD